MTAQAQIAPPAYHRNRKPNLFLSGFEDDDALPRAQLAVLWLCTERTIRNYQYDKADGLPFIVHNGKIHHIVKSARLDAPPRAAPQQASSMKKAGAANPGPHLFDPITDQRRIHDVADPRPGRDPGETSPHQLRQTDPDRERPDACSP